MTCSYKLVGLPRHGVCPECGTEIAKSQRGSLLVHSDPAYLKRLHLGVFTVQAGVVVMVLGYLAFILASTASNAARSAGAPGWTVTAGVSMIGSVGLSIVTAALTLCGWWLLSEADPRSDPSDRGERPRRLVRTSVGLEGVFTLLNQSLALLVLASAAIAEPLRIAAALLTLAQFVAFAVRYFASMQYVRWLSVRLPNQKVQSRARRMLWLGPVLITVGWACLALGPIVALVMYYNLLDLVRQQLKQIRKRVAEGDLPGERAPART